MVQIVKPFAVPTILQTKGKDATTELCRQYNQGKRKFKIKKSIYGNRAVRDVLIRAQHGKCCFCESIIGDDSDVEHFRPKAGVRKLSTHIGYYWLAYEWDNLLICCKPCNQLYKGTWFPLIDETKRANCHTDPLTEETPCFVHPSKDKVEEHIAFNEDQIYGLTDQGKETIRLLKLARPEPSPRPLGRGIWASRQDQYGLIIQLLAAWREAKANQNSTTEKRISELLDKYLQDDATFLAMNRVVIAAGGYPAPKA
jgi:uncharacterized protein (TIGR02646 family)